MNPSPPQRKEGGQGEKTRNSLIECRKALSRSKHTRHFAIKDIADVPDLPTSRTIDRFFRIHIRARTRPRLVKFFKHLADCGILGDAAEKAGMSVRTINGYTRQVEGFKELCDLCYQLAADKFEAAAIKRGRDGWKEPHFDKDGNECGSIPRFDGRLTLGVLAALKPDKYGQKIDVRNASVVLHYTISGMDRGPKPPKKVYEIPDVPTESNAHDAL